MFFILMLAFVLGANFYVFYRLYQMVPLTPVRILLVVVGVVLIASFILPFVLRDSGLSPAVLSVSYKVGTAWFFIFLYLLMAMLVLDIVRVTHLLPVHKILYNSWVGFFSVTGVVAVIMILGYIRYENKVRVPLDIKLNKEAVAAAPLKIVALSDMHLGYAIGRSEFEGWVEKINSEKPDLILIAGDMIDNSVSPLRHERMDEVFRQFRSTYGVYACMGNHEYISGSKESIRFLEDAGVTLLRDSAALIDNRLYVLGRDDRSSRYRKSTEEALAGLDRTKPVIMLDHQPYNLEEVEKNNVDVQISGHTHRGQLWPISWITDAIYEKSHGYLQKGNSHIYVSSGLGIWGGKFRIGTQSEYVVINLTL